MTSDSDMKRYLNIVFNPGSTQTKDPVFVALNCFRNKFYIKSNKIFNVKMLQFYQLFKKMEIGQQQLVLFLPFFYYLLCQYTNCQKLLCQKGVNTLLCVIDRKKRCGQVGKYIFDEQLKTLTSQYQQYTKQCVYATGLQVCMNSFLWTLGFSDYARNHYQLRNTIKQNIIALFLCNQNLWRHANQVFMAIIFRTLKRHWEDGYLRLKKLAIQCKYIDMKKTQQIMKILRTTQFQIILKNRK